MTDMGPCHGITKKGLLHDIDSQRQLSSHKCPNVETNTRQTLRPSPPKSNQRKSKNQRRGFKAACGGRCWHPFRYKSRGGSSPTPVVSSLLKGSQFCSHAKPWLKIVQHLPELAPGEGRGREVMMRSPCGSSME